MRLRTVLVLCLGFWVAVLACVPHVAFAEIHEGIGALSNWDFSDSMSTSSNEWDISVEIVALQGEASAGVVVAVRANFPGGVATVGLASLYDTLTTAPSDPATYTLTVLFVPNRTWVCRTREGHYVKFRFLDDLTQTDLFEYHYQDDGSTTIDETVPVRDSTWGRIKSLYQ